MTLTDILPSLRRSLPDPLARSAWPDHTTATTTDLIIAGVSMNALAVLCSTPAVHTGEFSIGGTGSRRIVRADRAVILTAVTMVVDAPGVGRVVIVDARLGALPVTWAETRLIGRASTGHRRPAAVLDGNESAMIERRPPVLLPDDIREGDILAVPCDGLTALHDVRPVRAETPSAAPMAAAQPRPVRSLPRAS